MTPEIIRLNKRLKFGRTFSSPKMTVITTMVDEKRVLFCVDMKNDPIQRNHRRGTFYEQKELEKLKSHFPKGGTFVDLGANVGNHSLFAALFLEAGRVIPFEPNPKAYTLLVNNVIVNGLIDTFDLTKLGVGVSDAHEGGYAMQKKDRNLGGAKMLAGEGQLEVYRADSLLEDVTPDMIKIDVEGMEMKVLDGLSGVLDRCSPVLLVEVDNENEEAFMKWANDNGYALDETYQRYRLNKNHLLTRAAMPGEKPAPGPLAQTAANVAAATANSTAKTTKSASKSKTTKSKSKSKTDA